MYISIARLKMAFLSLDDEADESLAIDYVVVATEL